MKLHLTMNDGTLVATFDGVEEFDFRKPMARAAFCVDLENEIRIYFTGHAADFDADGRDVTCRAMESDDA